MIITLSPVSDFNAEPLELEREGGDLIVNGVRHALADLAALEPDPDTDLIAWPSRVLAASEDTITLLFPYRSFRPHPSVINPAPIIDPPDGPVALPEDREAEPGSPEPS
jgi:hypothetical protein